MEKKVSFHVTVNFFSILFTRRQETIKMHFERTVDEELQHTLQSLTNFNILYCKSTPLTWYCIQDVLNDWIKCMDIQY